MDSALSLLQSNTKKLIRKCEVVNYIKIDDFQRLLLVLNCRVSEARYEFLALSNLYIEVLVYLDNQRV